MIALVRLKCQLNCCRLSDAFYKIHHKKAAHDARALHHPSEAPIRGFHLGTRPRCRCSHPPSTWVWCLFSLLRRALGESLKPLEFYRNPTCFWETPCSPSLRAGISGTKELWQIYGERRIFLQCCIPGKPSYTWFDSNNNSCTGPLSVNGVGWTTFPSCFYLNPALCWKCHVSCIKTKMSFSLVFFPPCFSARAKLKRTTFCWPLCLSLSFYITDVNRNISNSFKQQDAEASKTHVV